MAWKRSSVRIGEGTKLGGEGTEWTQNSRLRVLGGAYMAAKSLYVHLVGRFTRWKS